MPDLYRPIFMTTPRGPAFWSRTFMEDVLLAKRVRRKVTHPDGPGHYLNKPMNKTLDQHETPDNAADVVGRCVVEIRDYFNAPGTADAERQASQGVARSRRYNSSHPSLGCLRSSHRDDERCLCR